MFGENRDAIRHENSRESTVRRLSSKGHRVMLSVLIACGTSALAWAFNPAWFLTIPGGLLTIALFGQVASMTNRPLRLVLNVFATSLVLYLGGALWTWGNATKAQPTRPATRAVFIFWLILLVPWMLFGPLSAMAFDGGATAEAYVFFWSTITYPVSVALAAIFRKWFPYAVILPVLNLAACFSSSLLTGTFANVNISPHPLRLFT
jgi:hypothetical protein